METPFHIKIVFSFSIHLILSSFLLLLGRLGATNCWCELYGDPRETSAERRWKGWTAPSPSHWYRLILIFILYCCYGCPGWLAGEEHERRVCGRQIDWWWLPNGIIVVHVIIFIKMTTWPRSRHGARGLGIMNIIGPDLLIHWRSNFLNFWRSFALPRERYYYTQWLWRTDGTTIYRCRNIPFMGVAVV